MKLFRNAAVALSLAVPAVSFAAGFTVDFEKSWDFLAGDVNGYYNGGTAADGTTGPNLGVSFVNVSGLSNDPSFTYYANAPSPLGTAYFHTFDPSDLVLMNVAAGVANAIAFYYSSPSTIVNAVRAFSGLNGTGALLGTFSLGGNSSTSYDTWSQVTFRYSGLARSFDFTNSAPLVAIDNITSAVPEPGVVALMLLGACATLVRRKRR